MKKLLLVCLIMPFMIFAYPGVRARYVGDNKVAIAYHLSRNEVECPRYSLGNAQSLADMLTALILVPRYSAGLSARDHGWYSCMHNNSGQDRTLSHDADFDSDLSAPCAIESSIFSITIRKDAASTDSASIEVSNNPLFLQLLGAFGYRALALRRIYVEGFATDLKGLECQISELVYPSSSRERAGNMVAFSNTQPFVTYWKKLNNAGDNC